MSLEDLFLLAQDNDYAIHLWRSSVTQEYIYPCDWIAARGGYIFVYFDTDSVKEEVAAEALRRGFRVSIPQTRLKIWRLKHVLRIEFLPYEEAIIPSLDEKSRYRYLMWSLYRRGLIGKAEPPAWVVEAVKRMEVEGNE